MVGIEVAVSALLANLITKFVKPPQHHYTDEAIAARKTIIRIMNAIFGLAALLVTSWLMGDAVNVDSVGGFVEVIVGGAVTFLGSQGAYHLLNK